MQISPFNINVVQIKSFCYIWFKNWCLKNHRHYLQDCWKTHRGGLQTMIYTAIDTFYLTDEQLENSPSRKDGIDEATERTLRIYGCDLIQECGILLRLPQAVMATAQVLFHRFYCKKSFVRFNVKRVAVSCVWLASKLEESPRKARHILIVFHRMECRRENLPIQHLDPFSKKYADLKMDLNRTERHLLKEMAFICHVEHPHKFISNYLNSLGAPAELRQEAWNLANDSLRTTLCVRFKSEVVACGVIYIAARKNGVPLPENPPWWLAFDAEKSSIDEVCRVLARLYSLPKAQYLPVCRDGGSFTMSNKSWDSPSQLVPKEGSLTAPSPNNDSTTSKASNVETSDSKGVLSKLTVDKSKEPKKNDESETVFEGEARADPVPKIKHEHRREASGERNKDSARERERDRGERQQSRDRDRGKDSDRERENDVDRDREKSRDRSYRISDKGKDSEGLSEKLKQRLSRDRDYYESSHSRDKKRHRHH